jgi:hypothetical protein
MTLNNTYTIQSKSLHDLLNDIDKFTTNMNTFTSKHNGYKYNINIINNKYNTELWDAEIIIKHEKKVTPKASQDAVEPSTLL